MKKQRFNGCSDLSEFYKHNGIPLCFNFCAKYFKIKYKSKPILVEISKEAVKGFKKLRFKQERYEELPFGCLVSDLCGLYDGKKRIPTVPEQKKWLYEFGGANFIFYIKVSQLDK